MGCYVVNCCARDECCCVPSRTMYERDDGDVMIRLASSYKKGWMHIIAPYKDEKKGKERQDKMMREVECYLVYNINKYEYQVHNKRS